MVRYSPKLGALMLSLDCSHPDLEEFIGVKSDLDRITKANISVRVNNNFMKAVENDEDYELSFVRTETNEHITKKINAKSLFRKLAEMNWNYAEPGILFWDNITNYHLNSKDEEFELSGTNPCR